MKARNGSVEGYKWFAMSHCYVLPLCLQHQLYQPALMLKRADEQEYTIPISSTPMPTTQAES